jgi:hypothetical protein
MSQSWDQIIDHQRELSRIVAIQDDDTEYEARCAFDERVLSVDTKIVIEVLFQFGGPSSGYTLTGTREGMERAESWWHWGMDHSTFPVSEESEPHLWAWLSDLFDVRVTP